ncbi:MAG: Kelch repeat-containing protein, partial [Planctomycetota bacterium]
YLGGFGTSPFKEGLRPLEPDDFTQGPLLLVGRAFHRTVTTLDGLVVVTGGQMLDGTPIATTEVFDPDEGFFRTKEDLETARRFHTATLMADGRVFACGGFGPTGITVASGEIFDPDTGTWSTVPPMRTSRANHTASLLPNGRILVAGGFTTDPGSLAYTGTAEIYDPLRDQWTAAPDLVFERGAHTAVTMRDDRILFVGGARFGLKVAEIYDPRTGGFRKTAGDPAEHRLFHDAVLTRTGSVLIAGGGPPRSEQYDPTTDGFTDAGTAAPVGLPVSDSPDFATLTLLDEGRIVWIGGLSYGAAQGGGDLVLAQVQLWDSRGRGGLGSYLPMLFTLDPPRAGHTVNKLKDGTYMIVGGLGTSGAFNDRTTAILDPRRD